MTKTGKENILLLLLMMLSPVGFLGCATKPHIYAMPPGELEVLRSNIDTVGVMLLDSKTETVVKLPAKGSGQGIVRGAAAGATTTVIIGILAPIPLSAPAGFLLAPIGAVAGGVYGAATAMPANEVEFAETLLDQAAQEVRKIGLRDEFLDEVVRIGNHWTDLTFFKLSPANTSHSGGEAVEIDIQPDCDAILEISIDKTGLDAAYSIDPPIDLFVEVNVRLISTADGKELIQQTVVCRSDDDKTLKEWAQDGGFVFGEEFKGCGPELAEKIIDDFFLVYRISKPKKYGFF